MVKRVFWLLPLFLAACDVPQQTSHTVLPEPESEGAQMLKRFCSDCHAPPSPMAHPAEEWPNVLYRMQERRRTKAYPVMDEQEEATLLSYLRQYSKS